MGKFLLHKFFKSRHIWGKITVQKIHYHLTLDTIYMQFVLFYNVPVLLVGNDVDFLSVMLFTILQYPLINVFIVSLYAPITDFQHFCKIVYRRLIPQDWDHQIKHCFCSLLQGRVPNDLDLLDSQVDEIESRIKAFIREEALRISGAESVSLGGGSRHQALQKRTSMSRSEDSGFEAASSHPRSLGSQRSSSSGSRDTISGGGGGPTMVRTATKYRLYMSE